MTNFKLNFPAFSVGRHTLPGWVVKGHTQFQNQHSGPAETAKAILTQFSTVGFSFDDLMEAGQDFCGSLTPAVIWELTNKLSDDFLDDMEKLGKDIIQIPWSVGFSVKSEQIQREFFIDFSARARQRGIKVCAYLSLRNIFWKDAFEHEPFLKDVVACYSGGAPHLYGYSQSRYIACLEHPLWLDYIKQKVRMAIEQADVETIYFDNLGGHCACSLCRESFAEFTRNCIGKALAIPEVKQVLPRKVRERQEVEVVFAENEAKQKPADDQNHGLDYLWRRFKSWQNAKALGDIRDSAFRLKCPLGFSANNHLEPFINDVCNIIYSQDPRLPGSNRDNISILRYLEADTDGWKQQITNHVMPSGHDPRLSMAEAMAFQGYPYYITHKDYNRFYRDHPELFTGLNSIANVAVLMEYPGRDGNLSALGMNNIMYDVIKTDKWDEKRLSKYEVLVVADLAAVSNELMGALRRTADTGIMVVMTGKSGKFGAFGQPRSDNETEASNFVYSHEIIDRQLTKKITKAHTPPVEIDCSSRVAANLLRKNTSGYVLNLVNYDEKKIGPVSIRLGTPGGEHFNLAKVYSPDAPGMELTINKNPDGTFILENMEIFSILVFS